MALPVITENEEEINSDQSSQHGDIIQSHESEIKGSHSTRVILSSRRLGITLPFVFLINS